MKTINGFQGEYRFLSNFWPCQVLYNNVLYPTTEHAYQAAKVESPDIRAGILHCETPAAAKDYFENHHIKPDLGWTVEKKLMVMEDLIRSKFEGKEPFLTRALLATGEATLIEGNTWDDTFWGVCNNVGENHLGKILMKIREELFREKEQIILALELKKSNVTIASTLSINQRALYEKMVAFKIQNKEFWIS